MMVNFVSFLWYMAFLSFFAEHIDVDLKICLLAFLYSTLFYSWLTGCEPCSSVSLDRKDSKYLAERGDCL